MPKKVPSNRIPETHYDRFKSRLEELYDPWKERNITLFLLGIATGYRLQDIVDLTIKDINEALENGYFDIQEKKQYNTWLGNKKRYPKSVKKPPITRKHDIVPQLNKILKKYIRGKRNSEYAFPSQKGGGSKYITQKAFSDILKNVAEDKELKLTNITGHSLRKTYARRLYEKTNDLEYVREALGHKSIEVTKRYLGIVDEIKRDAAKVAAEKL